MKLITILFSIIILSSQSSLAYDSSWHKSDGWSGEYPAGFQVYKKGISLLGRPSVDQFQQKSVNCVLKRNKYSASKAIPKADYLEMTLIVNMYAKIDFDYKTYVYSESHPDLYEEKVISIKKGDLVEYLNYGAEGWFTVRHNGEVFDADQDLLENVTYPMNQDGWMDSKTDQWVKLSCVNNISAWFMLSDFYSVDEEGNETWIDGIQYYFHNPY